MLKGMLIGMKNTASAFFTTLQRAKHRAAAVAAALLVFAAAAFVCAPGSRAEGAVNVATDAELLAALTNASVSSINLTGDVTLTAPVPINRTLAVTGSGAVLSFSEGAGITTTAQLTLSGIAVDSQNGYAVTSTSQVILGEGFVFAGGYGVRLAGGGSITSGGRQIRVSQPVVRAVGIDCAGGKVNITNLSLVQDVGSTTLLYIHPSAGELIFGGSTKIVASAGSAAMCPTGGQCPSVTVADNADTELSAPNSSNASGGELAGAALDIRGGAFSTGANAKIKIIGSENGVAASSIMLGNGTRLTASCMKQGTAAGAGSGSAALWTKGALRTGAGVSIAIGTDQVTCSNGIYAGDGIDLGVGTSFAMRGNGGQSSAICTPQQLIVGANGSIVANNCVSGLLCDNGLTTGETVTIDLTGMSKWGIRGTGTLQANKLTFGEKNTVTVSAGHCAIYTRESLDVLAGSSVELHSGTTAPALWIDAETDSQGHLAITGSSAVFTSKCGADTACNAAVYCVGAITVDGASSVVAENSGDFGMISAYGDINVSGNSRVCTSGGCGMYLLCGNLRLTSGGALFAEGTVDSGVRVEQGVLNAGEQTSLDVQGARFGVEVLAEGGVWINGASQFDIRSTRDRAVFVESGTMNIENVDRVSVWQRAGDGNNVPLWWREGAADGVRSWDILSTLPESDRLYADYTALAPNGVQHYTAGEASSFSGFDLLTTTWDADGYSRIGMYYSRPVARANAFFIPAGRSFSWWLYGESYDGGATTFELKEHKGEGDFTLKENGRFTYYAPQYTRGMQYFTFVVRDSSGLESLPVTVGIKVTASKPPIASSATFAAKSGEKLIGSLEMTDYDGLIADTEVIEQPQHGKLILASDGQFSYTPETLFHGLDSFTYKAIDSMGDESNEGYVSIVVDGEGGLYACNDTIITESGVASSLRLTTLDTAPEPEPGQEGEQAGEAEGGEAGETEPAPPPVLNYTISQLPTYGVITFAEGDTIEYTPYEDFAGSDIIKFYVTDSLGNVSNEATLSVATIPNQRPVVTTAVYNCTSGLSCKGTLSAQDVDGTIVSYAVTKQPESGRLTFNELTGSFTYRAAFGSREKVYFTFTATDNDGLSSREGVIEIDVLSLGEYLRSSGKMKSVMIASIGVAASLLVIVLVLATGGLRRRKERRLEEERERLNELLASRAGSDYHSSPEFREGMMKK